MCHNGTVAKGGLGLRVVAGGVEERGLGWIGGWGGCC